MAINQDVLEQVFAHLTTGQLLRSAALVCKDWKAAAANQSPSIRVTICGNSKMAQSFWRIESLSSDDYTVDEQLARFKRWLAKPSDRRSVEKLDLTYIHPDVFWGVSEWWPRPLLLELLPRGLSQLRSLRLTNVLLRNYSWRELADGCKHLTRLELEQSEGYPGSIEYLKPLSALVHLSLKHFEGDCKDWKGTFDNMGQLTHLSLESCTYNRCWWGSDRGEEDPDTVRETLVAGLSKLQQLHLDLWPHGFYRGPMSSGTVTIIGYYVCRPTRRMWRSTAFRASEWQRLQHENDFEYYNSLLKNKSPQQPAKEVQISKHSQRWISSMAAKQRTNQSRQGNKAKCQQLRCFKRRL